MVENNVLKPLKLLNQGLKRIIKIFFIPLTETKENSFILFQSLRISKWRGQKIILIIYLRPFSFIVL